MFPLAGSDISNLKVFKTPVMWDSSAINSSLPSPSLSFHTEDVKKLVSGWARSGRGREGGCHASYPKGEGVWKRKEEALKL
jgi:hypothetical protein